MLFKVKCSFPLVIISSTSIVFAQNGIDRLLDDESKEGVWTVDEQQLAQGRLSFIKFVQPVVCKIILCVRVFFAFLSGANLDYQS